MSASTMDDVHELGAVVTAPNRLSPGASLAATMDDVHELGTVGKSDSGDTDIGMERTGPSPVL
jgi:hypothetical protein